MKRPRRTAGLVPLLRDAVIGISARSGPAWAHAFQRTVWAFLNGLVRSSARSGIDWL